LTRECPKAKGRGEGEMMKSKAQIEGGLAEAFEGRASGTEGENRVDQPSEENPKR